MVQQWLRFKYRDEICFGTLEEDVVRIFRADMFATPQPTGTTTTLAEIQLLAPVVPGKVLALWNNFHALSRKLELEPPKEPLYLIKPSNTYLAPLARIRKSLCDGKGVFEGELGIVIGRTCTDVAEEHALDHVFGYTCGNDVTVVDIIKRAIRPFRSGCARRDSILSARSGRSLQRTLIRPASW